MTGIITRGKLTRADLAQWDGKTATHSRVDASGGTITGLAVGNEVDVLQVFGGGTSRTRGTIGAAIQHIGSTADTLVFAPGTWTIDDDLTIPSNFTCHIPRGCVFSVDSGKTLTFNGPIQRESESWYSGSGTVTYTAANNVLLHTVDLGRVLYPRTAAEIASGVTPTDYSYPGDGDVAYNVKRLGMLPAASAATNTTALQNAINVMDAAGGGIVFIPEGSYNFSAAFTALVPTS